MQSFYNRGITALEILIVLGVLAVLFSVALPQFGKVREEQVLKTGVADILSSIDRARAKTLSSFDSSSYGVHFESDKVIIFKGAIFSAVDSNNETMYIASPAAIADVTLGGVSGPSGDMYFNRLSGTPSKTGTITITSPNYSKIITISGTGIGSVN